MLAEQFIGEDVVAQAVAAQWKQIGVTVNLTDESQIPAAIGAAMTRQFPVIPLLALNSPEYLLASSFLLPAPNPGNPFATSDAQLSSLLGQAAATSDTATRNSLYQHAMAMIVNLAWFAPVVTIDGVFAADAKITGWKSPIFDITAIKPA
jgi:peptide/nickel transport system substrate-binding protein